MLQKNIQLLTRDHTFCSEAYVVQQETNQVFFTGKVPKGYTLSILVPLLQVLDCTGREPQPCAWWHTVFATGSHALDWQNTVKRVMYGEIRTTHKPLNTYFYKYHLKGIQRMPSSHRRLLVFSKTKRNLNCLSRSDIYQTFFCCEHCLFLKLIFFGSSRNALVFKAILHLDAFEIWDTVLSTVLTLWSWL